MATLGGSDEGVIATNDAAAASKLSAVSLGYWKDPFLPFFLPGGVDRRPPEINRGTYARTTAVTMLVRQFIQVNKGQCQVVSLGAGFDTLFWRLNQTGDAPRLYVELDLSEVTARKTHCIARATPLLQAIQHEDYDIQLNRCNVHAFRYKLCACDVRVLSELQACVQETGLDPNLPTVFIAECVLVYLCPTKSQQLLKFIVNKFRSAFFINYEMVNLRSRFGEVMLANLRQRHADLLGAAACSSVETQQDRFLTEGWAGAEATSLLTVWQRLPRPDLARVTRLEMLDEGELLTQLLDHYALTTAWTDTRWAEIQL